MKNKSTNIILNDIEYLTDDIDDLKEKKYLIPALVSHISYTHPTIKPEQIHRVVSDYFNY